jgi:hypothetical protein
MRKINLPSVFGLRYKSACIIFFFLRYPPRWKTSQRIWKEEEEVTRTADTSRSPLEGAAAVSAVLYKHPRRPQPSPRTENRVGLLEKQKENRVTVNSVSRITHTSNCSERERNNKIKKIAGTMRKIRKERSSSETCYFFLLPYASSFVEHATFRHDLFEAGGHSRA